MPLGSTVAGSGSRETIGATPLRLAYTIIDLQGSWSGSDACRLHHRIQAITKVENSPPDRFKAETDIIVEDRRSSRIIECFLKHEDLPNYLEDLASLPGAGSL
ncbi:hypothetical protein OAE15_01120 [Verrucomicrobiales bacterium]|jgi:hypothetical protein|nr:hypothetical protein [Verrucomicrobiales bacterium]